MSSLDDMRARAERGWWQPTGRSEHEEALLLHPVQAGRRIDDEVCSEPALSQRQLAPHRIDEDEPTEHAGCLGECQDCNDEGSDGVGADVHERNSAQ